MLTLFQTDRSIIGNVLRGRIDRFGVLVDRYGRLVYAIAYAYLRNPHDAEEVVQESYTRLYERLDTLSWKQNIGPWLAQVARSVAIDRLRKRQHEVLVADPPPASITHLPNPARDEMRQLVAEQLGHLDTADREVLLLHYFLGKKAREIAALLDIQPDAAKKRLQRARDELGRRLVDVLKEDLVEDRAEPARRRRVMAAITTAAIPWKPSAAAAVAVSVITGASATKTTLVVAATMAVIFAGLLVGLRLWFPGLHFLPRPIQATSQYIPNAPPAPSVVTTAGAAKADVEPAPAPEPDVAAAAKHGPGRPVSGIVVTEQGQPVSGAKVTVDNLYNVKWREDRKSDVTMTPLAPFQLSTVSGPDGTFSFASVPFTLERRDERVNVSAEVGGLSGETSFYCMPDLTDEFLQITVRPCATLAGIATDTAGVPIEDACILLKETREIDAGFMGRVPSRTGPDGRFLIKHVMRGEYKLMIGADGYSSLLTDWFPSGKTDIVIKLDRGNSISGRVTEFATGTPVVSGHIAAWWEETQFSSSHTDAEGKFTLTGFAPGKVRVWFVTRGIPPSPYILPDPVVVTVVEGRSVTGLEMKVFRGAVLSGQVTDAASGTPLPGVLLTVTGDTTPAEGGGPGQRATRQEVKSGPDGHYEAPGLPPGDLELAARATGYAEKSVKVHVGDYGQSQRVDVKMEILAVVQGTVVGSTDAPVAGASVAAVYATGNTGPWPDTAITDPSGNFRLNLPKNNPVRLQAWHQSATSPVSAAVAPGAKDVVLRLADGGCIEGTVVDAAGGMVGGARVSILPADDEAQQILRFKFVYDRREEKLLGMPQEASGTTCSTSNGLFRSGLLRAGYYDLKVYTPLSEWAAGSTRVLVREGQTLQTRLRIDSTGFAAIEGRVTTNGLPRRGALVVASEQGHAGNDATTDEDGRYRIYPAPTGSVTVTLRMQDTEREQKVDVTPGETATADFDVPVVDTAVEGTVRMNGQPLAEAAVSLFSANGEEPQNRVTVSTDAEGSFRVQNLTEGDYRCEVVALPRLMSRPEFVLRETREISVTSGSTTQVEFDLAGAAIEGVVSGVRKGEYARAWLLMGDAEAPEISPAVIAMLDQKTIAGAFPSLDGVVQFFGLAPGPYVVVAVALPPNNEDLEVALLKSVLAGRYAAVQVQAPAGEVAQVDLALP
jgi:RNA polymerase sigma factor (sigma-70 family)